MKKIIMILTVALLAASCDKYDVTEVLLQRSDISLTWKGKLQMSYNESSCQLGFNEEKKEFRVYDDALEYWFIVRCNQMPRHVDQTLTWNGRLPMTPGLRRELNFRWKKQTPKEKYGCGANQRK